MYKMFLQGWFHHPALPVYFFYLPENTNIIVSNRITVTSVLHIPIRNRLHSKDVS